MSIALPTGANLEHLKKQAKRLRAGVAAGDAPALQRVHAVREAASAAGTRRLSAARALLVIAREYGFASWPKLKEAVESTAKPADPVAAFLRAACGGRLGEARALLRSAIAPIRGNLWAASAAGEADAVETHLAGDAAAAKRTGGPLGRAPLQYLCWSNLLGEKRRTPGFLRAARALLAHGADPNALNADAPKDHPKTLLFGALGVPELARILLDAGSDPNQGGALYHSCRYRDHGTLKLLLGDPRIAREEVSSSLLRILDFDDVEGLRLFLAAGADPNRHQALLKAIRRPGRSLEVIRLLLEHGADRAARTANGASAYALARRAGNSEIAELVRLPGDDGALPPVDEFLAACSDADTPRARRIATEHPGLATGLDPEQVAALTQAAWHGRSEVVLAMLDAGVPIGARDGHGTTALHNAAYRADLALVDELLARGAPLDVKDTEYSGTPLDWACAGSLNDSHEDNRPDADHVPIVERLLAAGSRIEHVWGSEEVLAVLQRHGAA